MTEPKTIYTPEIVDEPAQYEVTASQTVLTGRIWDVVRDDVDLGHTTVTREYVAHPGAVAVVAMNERDEVALLRQYRHPVRSFLWEIPAGLLDVPGEPLVEAAARELAEEADLRAAIWHTLADYYTSPGGSDEPIRIFLAQGLTEVPEADRYVREDEELGMEVVWVGLSDVVELILAGKVHNPSLVVGALAAAQSRSMGWTTLRDPAAPWVRE